MECISIYLLDALPKVPMSPAVLWLLTALSQMGNGGTSTEHCLPLCYPQLLQVHSTQQSHCTWIRSTATIPGQIWRQYEGPQMAF